MGRAYPQSHLDAAPLFPYNLEWYFYEFLTLALCSILELCTGDLQGRRSIAREAVHSF